MLFSFLSLVGLALAYADTSSELHAHDDHMHDHVHVKREYPQVPLTPPYRPLVWGDFNVIHTTDTHGWLLGHQKTSWPEPNYSGDLGDFASFVANMKEIASQKDVDLLLVDSGDLHDGTGLSDGYPPDSVDGHETDEILKHLPYDVMAIGNHELYNYSVALDMYTNFAPYLSGRYLTSNVNITISGKAGSVPIGNRSVTFTTRKNRTVTSIGPIFDTKGNLSNGTFIRKLTDMVNETWFAEAIAQEPDVFLLVGHIPVSDANQTLSANWHTVFQAIRDKHQYTPILIFGGHSHIRDCQLFDGRSMALQSGRYMETIGWMSAELDAAKGNTNNITFSRRYLDQNRVTYEYHTTMSNTTFDTPYGRITHDLYRLADTYNLTYLYGTAPQDYYLTQNAYPSSANILTFFIKEAAPFVFNNTSGRANIPHLIISNTGVLRYDIFKGNFTKNDQLTASPYPDTFSYIPNVTAGVANRILPALNNGTCRKSPHLENEERDDDDVNQLYYNWLEDMNNSQPALNTTGLTPGYNTTDKCEGVPGDDTLHTPVPVQTSPDYIGSDPPQVPSDDTPIDLVFLSFFNSTVLCVLKNLTGVTYTPANTLYTNTTSNEVLGLYAEANWK